MYKLLLLLFFVAAIPCCIAQNTTQPHFPGEENSLNDYLQEQTNRLQEQIARFSLNDKYAVSTIFFYVGTDGKILRPTVATAFSEVPNFPADSLALAIVEQMPNWIPGAVAGVAQEMPTSVTVRFGNGRERVFATPIPDTDLVSPTRIEFSIDKPVEKKTEVSSNNDSKPREDKADLVIDDMEIMNAVKEIEVVEETEMVGSSYDFISIKAVGGDDEE